MTGLCLSLLISVQAQPFGFWKTQSAPASSPASGYKYWWRGDMGLATNGPMSGDPAGVVTWTDQSSGLVLSANGSNQPQETPNAKNGHTVLTFALNGGTGQVLANTTATLSSSWELFAVVETGSDIANGDPFCIESDNGTARGVFVSEAEWEQSWNATTFGGSPSPSTWYVIDALYSAGGTSTLSINGTQVLTQSGLSLTVTGINVGTANTQYPWDGAIAEMLIYTTPPGSAAETTTVSYLRTKYNF